MIIVDQREKRCVIPRKLEDMKLPVTYSMLAVGDYVVSGRESLVVERKDAHDYLSSMVSGHLNNQLYEMSTNYPYSVLIVEGFITEALMFRKMKRLNYDANVAHAILKRSMEGSSGVVSVVSLDTPFDTAWFLKSAHDCLNSEDGLIRAPVLRSKKNKRNISQGILASFPHVGENRAKLLLQKFGTLENVLNADIKQICEIPGIGGTIAKSIIEVYRGEKNSVI